MVADKRPPVVKTADLPEPHRISVDDFEEIVCRFKIPLARRPALRDFLDEMVEEFAGAISRERSLPNQRADRGQIDKARKAIAKARVAINLASGPAAKAALRRTAGCIGTMLSASWIRGRFPHDRIAPDLHFWPDDGRSVRTSARVPARPVPIDDLSRDERAYFAEHRARELIVAVLNVFDATLAETRRRIVTPREDAKGIGGRIPMVLRRYLLANLARFWRVLGRIPGRGVRSSGFPDFADAVCDAIGWPTDGVYADLPKAIKLSRNWR